MARMTKTIKFNVPLKHDNQVMPYIVQSSRCMPIFGLHFLFFAALMSPPPPTKIKTQIKHNITKGW